MTSLVTITAVEFGWAVESETLTEPLVFRSGAQAEAEARAIAERRARLGAACEVRVYLRDGSLGGRFMCVPPQALRTTELGWAA